LKRLCIINVTDTFGGAAWCMSISNRVNDCHTIAVGCDDGGVRFFSYAEGGLEYKRAFPVVGAKVMSIALHPKSNRMYLGCSDGTIRCIDEV
jgi:hypothetical protein